MISNDYKLATNYVNSAIYFFIAKAKKKVGNLKKKINK